MMVILYIYGNCMDRNNDTNNPNTTQFLFRKETTLNVKKSIPKSFLTIKFVWSNLK